MRREIPTLHAGPAVGFEQPFEMLEACHERVQRSLALLERLIEHVDAQGHDAKSRSAAHDVLRYFDLAAPHHHEDEERHVFPRLLALGDATLVQAVQRLREEHQRMGELWARLRPVLLVWSGEHAAGAVPANFRADARDLSTLYAAHIPVEEGLVFPGARSQLDDGELQAMGDEMRVRRGAVATMPR